MMLRVQELVLPVLAAGAVAAVVRARRSEAAKTSRGRLRELAWSAALLLLSMFALSTVYDSAGNNFLDSWGLLFPLGAATVIAVRPGWVRRIVPWALIGYGLVGFIVLRGFDVGGSTTTYALTTNNWDAEAELIPLQAYLFMLLGGWLLWREMWRPGGVALERRRRLLGRLTDMQPRAQFAALLLLPLAIAVAAFAAGWRVGIFLIPVLLAGSFAVVRRRPELAARTAAAGLVGFGLVGLALAAGAGFGIIRHAGIDYRGVLYGPILVMYQQTRAPAAVESIGVLALGAWLVPQAFPQVRRLLGMAPDADLLNRVQQLAESRAVAVDTASADLRRLERDLHDGAQARLVALGMSLRAAERLIPTSPEAAIALVAEARETSARALTELRELVRGVLPPVLADRGIADAIRALALDSPLAVATDIDLPGRLPAPVETACYFAVAELLTNAAKHSGARDARIVMSHAAGILRTEVTDFGLGGADPSAGSGLAGVERRLATFDGIMAISSPVGGPTIVVMEVPCALSSPKTSSC
jgi:signal transduction histidine kinase